MHAHVRKMKLAALALLCGASAARAGGPGAGNRVTSIEKLGAAGKLAIHGTQQPAFTVFKLDGPPRLVIDLASADVSAVASGLAVTTGAVKGVTAAQFDEGGQHVGRLVVMLDGDAQYDVKPSGNDLLVSVTRASAQNDSQGEAAQAVASAQPAPAADANLVVQRDDTRDVKRPAHRLASVAVQGVNGQTRVHLATDGQVASYTLIELKDPARLAVDLHGVMGSARKVEGQGEVKGVRVAKHDDGVRVVVDGQGARMPSYDIQRSANGLDVMVGNPAVVAEAPAPAVQTIRAPAAAPVQLASVKLTAPAKASPTAPVEKAPAAEVAAEAPAEEAPSARLAPNGKPAVEAAQAPVAAIENASVAAPQSMKIAQAQVAQAQPAQAVNAPAAEPIAHAEQAPIEVAPAPVEKARAKNETQGEPQAAKSKSAPATVRTVDLDANADHTQVAIAIDGAFKFEVGHPDAKTVVLTVFNAQLPERLERNLDASALGGAIDMLSSYRISEKGEKGAMVKIVAALHAPCGDEVVAHMGGLTWKFNTPAATVAISPVAVTPRAAAMAADEKPADQNVLDDRNYSGRRVDFNVKDIDIRNLLGAIADISKKNIILADDVKGTVTIKLRNVPWDQALDIILKSKALGKEEVGNIIRIAPIERLRQEQKDAADAAKIKQTYEPLKVRLISVNYATASTLIDKIKDSLTERGSVSVDVRTNTVIVKDVQDSIIRAEGIVRNLDTQTPEVLIESRIVEASINFTREAGIQWGGNVSLSPATGNSTGLVFPNILQVAGAADDPAAPLGGLTGVTQPNFAVNMPAAIGLNNGGGLGFVLGSAGGAAQLNLRLSAAENSGNLKTISSPRIQTLDNIEASIGQGVQIPFSQVSASGVNTQFIEAKLELRVTPHVTQEGAINMKITATNNQPNAALTGANGQPAISNREAKTQVLVKDGDTTVIGGIYTRTNSEQWNEVPILSRIPILGWLFKKKAVSDQRTELLIFITPHIVNRSESAVANANDDVKQ